MPCIVNFPLKIEVQDVLIIHYFCIIKCFLERKFNPNLAYMGFIKSNDQRPSSHLFTDQQPTNHWPTDPIITIPPTRLYLKDFAI